MKQHPCRPELWVTPDGRVFRELHPSKDDAGYHQIRNGKFRQRRHVLVAETYHGPKPFEKAVVRHKNGDELDDTATNLEWGTQKENGGDAVVHGTTAKGEKNAMHKLTEAAAEDILARRVRLGRWVESLPKNTVCRSRPLIFFCGRTWSHLRGT